jgi:hypothetical protein
MRGPTHISLKLINHNLTQITTNTSFIRLQVPSLRSTMHEVELMHKVSVQQIRDAWTAPDTVDVNFCAEWSILKFRMSKGASKLIITNKQGHHHLQWDKGNLYAQWDPSHDHFLGLCHAYSEAGSETWPLLYTVHFYCPGKSTGSDCGTYEPTTSRGLRRDKHCQGRVQLHMSVFVKPVSNPRADQTWQQLTVVSLRLSSNFEHGRHVALPENLHLAFQHGQAQALEALIQDHGKRLSKEQETQRAPFRAVLGEGPIRQPIRDVICQVAEDFTPSSIQAHLHARSLQLLGNTNLKHHMNVNLFPHLRQIQRLVDNARRKKKAFRDNVAEEGSSVKPGAKVRHPLRKKAAWPDEQQLQDISVGEVETIIALLNLEAADEVSIAEAHRKEKDWGVLFSSKAMARIAAEYGTKIIGLDFVWKIGTYKTLSEVAEAILAQEQNIQPHFLHWMMHSVKLNSNTGLLKDVKLGLAVLVVHVPSDRMHSDLNHLEGTGSGDGKTFIAGIALCSGESKAVCTFLIQKLRLHVKTFISESLHELRSHHIQENLTATICKDVSPLQAKALCFPVLRLCCRNPLMYSSLDAAGDTPTGMRLLFLVQSLATFCAKLWCASGCEHNDMLFECHLLCKHQLFRQIVSSVHMAVAKLAELELQHVLCWEPALAIDEGKGARYACDSLNIKWLFCEWHLWYNWGQELDMMEAAMLTEEQQGADAIATTVAEVQTCIRRCVQRVRTMQEAQDCCEKFDEAMVAIAFHKRHGIGSAAVLAFKKYFAAKLKDKLWVRAVSDWGRLEVGVMRSKLGHTNMLSESVVRKLSAQVMNGVRPNLSWPSMLVFSNLVLQLEDIQSTWHHVGMQQEGSLSKEILRVRSQDVMARSLCYCDRVAGVDEFGDPQARGHVTSLAGARVRVWWSNERKWYSGWLGLQQQTGMCSGNVYSVAYEDGAFMAVMYPDVHGFVQVTSVPGEENHLDVLDAAFDFPLDDTRPCFKVATVSPFAPNCGQGDSYVVTMQHAFHALGATCTCSWFKRTGKSDCKHVDAVVYRNRGAPVLKPGVHLQEHVKAATELYRQQAGDDQWTVAGVFARKPIDIAEQPAVSYRVSYVGYTISQWVPAEAVGDMAIINKYPLDLAFRVASGTASASVTAMNRARSNKRGLKNKPTRKSKKSHKSRDFCPRQRT